MNANVDKSENTAANTGKLIAAIAILAVGVGLFYAMPWSWAVRTVVLVLAIGAALFVGAQTRQGLVAREFFSESHFELRKVVWPTRQETMQTTLVILVVVTIISIMLWLIDMFLGWVILEQLLKSAG
jgi:preprotein translocase subunit SecE